MFIAQVSSRFHAENTAFLIGTDFMNMEKAT